MSILITGANGFIGSSFLRYFTSHDIYSISRSKVFSTNKKIISADLLDTSHVTSVINYLRDKNITHLFHFAGSKLGTKYQRDSDPNLMIAKHIATVYRTLSIKEVIFASGWVVYDGSEKIPFHENMICIPQSAYGKSKFEVEKYLLKNKANSTIISIRLGSVYGPGQLSSGLIPNLVTSSMDEGEMKLKSLKTKRDYIYIDDVMRCFERILHNPTKDSMTINLGGNRSHTVESIAKKVKKIYLNEYKKIINVVHGSPIVESFPPDNRLDMDKAYTYFKTTNTTSIEKGLQKYITWKNNPTIIFDLDGTMVDVTSRWYQLHVDLSKKYEFKPHRRTPYIEMKRNGISEAHILGLLHIDSEVIEAYNKDRLDRIEDPRYLSLNRVKKGLKPLLRKLSKNYTLILLTKRLNKISCLEEIKNKRLDIYFDSIIITGSLSKIEAADTLLKKFVHKNTIMIGDTEDDFNIAGHLHSQSIIMTDGVRSKKTISFKPDYIIDSYKELPTILTI